MNNKTIILTGDRPTGPLHLGHYVGSLRQRAALQHDYQQFILVADLPITAAHRKRSATIFPRYLPTILPQE